MNEATQLSYPEPGTKYEGPDNSLVERYTGLGFGPLTRALLTDGKRLAQAKLDAQRIRQRAWNTTAVEPPRQPLSARKIVTALAGVYGYAPTFNGLRLPGLKLRA